MIYIKPCGTFVIGSFYEVFRLKKGTGKVFSTSNAREILPILSKIFKKHAASSLSIFLRDNNLLYELQSAFRSGHSTETALIILAHHARF